MNLFASKNKNIFIILSVFIILAILLIIKVNIYDSFIPDWDEGHHLTMALYYLNGITDHSWPTLRDVFFQSHQIYPPIYHILTSVSYILFGLTANAGIFTNIPFILILMLSVYGLGTIFGSKNAGLLASTIVPILPVFLSLQERTTIDYLSISVFMVSFFLIFKTDYFINRKYSIMFAISILVGLLIKWPVVVPSIPFLFYATNSLFKEKNKRILVCKNLLITLIITSTALVWYIPNLKYILSDLNFYWGSNSYPQLVWNFPRGLSIKNIMLYLYSYPSSNGVGLLTLLAFYVSVFVIKKSNKIWYLLSSVIVTYIVLTITTDKSEYYISYCYPILILITSLAIFEIKHNWKRNILVMLVTIPIVLNFAFTQYNYISYKQYFIRIYGRNLLIIPNYFTKFNDQKWPTKEIVDKHINIGNCPNGVLFFPDNRYLNFSDIRYYLMINNVDIKYEPAHRYYNPATDKKYNLEALKNYSCIVTKTGDAGSFSSVEVVEWVNQYLSSNKLYNLVTFNAPDDTVITLYIKR